MTPTTKELAMPQLPSEEQIMDALNRGVNAALLEHKRAGIPIVVWQDGTIKHIPADEIVVPDEMTESC